MSDARGSGLGFIYMQQVNSINGLVQLSRGQHPRGRLQIFSRLAAGPVVDKYFFLAVIGSFFGVAVLGVHLWLIRAGVMSVEGHNYAEMRLLHAAIQLFVFFGCCALGFVIQAAPKLFGSPEKLPVWCLLPLVLIPSGVIALYLFPGDWPGPLLTGSAFFVPVVPLLRLARSGNSDRVAAIGYPVLFGLIGLVVSAWLHFQSPVGALIFMWIGMFPLIYAAAQQFGSGFLNGAIVSRFRMKVLLSLHLLSSAVLLVGYFSGGTVPSGYLMLFGSLAAAAIIFFLFSSRLLSSLLRVPGNAFELGFSISSCWACISPALAAAGVITVDQLLHLWASGTGMTLIFVVSGRILGFLSGKPVLKGRTLAAIVLLWQVVPLTRGFGIIEQPLVAWIGTVVAGLCVVIWGIAILRVVISMNIRQFTLRGDEEEEMVQC